jgi:flagellum-specific ATP synthase
MNNNRPAFSATSLLQKYAGAVRSADTLSIRGRVKQVVGLTIESQGPQGAIGDVCHLIDPQGNVLCRSEIVGFREDRILSMVLGDVHDIAPGTEILSTGSALSIGVGNELLGRVLDGLGNPIDGKGALPSGMTKRSVYAQPPNPLLRKRIQEPISTGIRAIDGLLTIGKGQRVGIFAGSGVGKSTILGMIARNSSADVNVIGLVGERGRELREFIERDL